MLRGNIYDSIEMLPARGCLSRAPPADCNSASCNAQARDPRKRRRKRRPLGVPPQLPYAAAEPPRLSYAAAADAAVNCVVAER